ncbi:RAI1 like PD-XK nuclease-domain-containing protein [Mycena rosella]|uniref:Decapping nuclease n=1 Tax=Mycena rosella TaxID=1033263 RepID=A0AAD7MA24_MYCRO|nr:RAI1 like PD-XK nuclease-domain-containing protein [Mycena rosella]
MSKRPLSPTAEAPPPTTKRRRSRSASPASLSLPSTHKLAFSATASTAGPSPAFQQPTQLISFSYTPEREFELTDSALRYLVQPPRNAQLAHAYDRWERRPERRSRIDGLLRALSAARAKRHPALASGVGVVAWRGVMTRILTSPYEEREGWDLNVMCVDGVLYFEEHLSDARLREKNDIEPRHRLQTYFGYAFESYCTSHTPGGANVPQNPGDPPGWGGDVDTNVQWCSVVRTKLGDTRMVIGGEVDCVREKYTGATDTFVELKTSLVIRGPHDEVKFEKRLLKFYMQSFLLGVPEILVGFRTPAGQVSTTQVFKTVEIPRLVRGKLHAWDPTTCLRWGNAFLGFLQAQLKGQPERDVWRVRFTPGMGVELRALDAVEVEDVVAGEERVGFLPRVYWDEVRPKNGTKAAG